MTERMSDETFKRIEADVACNITSRALDDRAALLAELRRLRSLAAVRAPVDEEVAAVISALRTRAAQHTSFVQHSEANRDDWFATMPPEVSASAAADAKHLEAAADLLTRLSAAKAEAERERDEFRTAYRQAADAVIAQSKRAEDCYNAGISTGIVIGEHSNRDGLVEGQAGTLLEVFTSLRDQLSASERRLATAREALTAETDLADKALEYACGLAAAGGGITTGLPAEEIARRLDNHTRQCNEVYDWSYPIRRARHAARDPNHPDNAALQPETKPE